MFYFLVLNSGSVFAGNDISVYPVTGTVDLGCNEIKGSQLKFRYNQGFVTDKVLYNMYN